MSKVASARRSFSQSICSTKAPLISWSSFPLTTRSKSIRSHIPLTPPEAGLSEVSYIKCEDIRSVSKQRLSNRIGTVSPATLRSVETRVRFLLGL